SDENARPGGRQPVEFEVGRLDFRRADDGRMALDLMVERRDECANQAEFDRPLLRSFAKGSSLSRVWRAQSLFDLGQSPQEDDQSQKQPGGPRREKLPGRVRWSLSCSYVRRFIRKAPRVTWLPNAQEQCERRKRDQAARDVD